MSDSSDPTPNPDNLAEPPSPPVGVPPPPPPAMTASPATVPTPGLVANREMEVRQWAMFLHLSALAGLVVPMAGIVVPIVLWQVKKTEMPELDVHGRMVVNWMISSIIYAAVSFVLCFILIGIPLLMVLAVLAIVFPIIGGIKANNGEFWNYPITIKFL